MDDIPLSFETCIFDTPCLNGLYGHTFIDSLVTEENCQDNRLIVHKQWLLHVTRKESCIVTAEIGTNCVSLAWGGFGSIFSSW